MLKAKLWIALAVTLSACTNAQEANVTDASSSALFLSRNISNIDRMSAQLIIARSENHALEKSLRQANLDQRTDPFRPNPFTGFAISGAIAGVVTPLFPSVNTQLSSIESENPLIREQLIAARADIADHESLSEKLFSVPSALA